MNEQNLKQFGHEKPPSSHEEAVKNGKKGGRNSGKARRQRKRMKQAAEAVLSMPLPKGSKARDTLKQLGVSESNTTYMFALVASMINSACNGDVGAAEFIRDLVEGSPAMELKMECLELRKLQFELREVRHDNETWSQFGMATGKMSQTFLAALKPAEAIKELFRNPQPNRNIEDYE